MANERMNYGQQALVFWKLDSNGYFAGTQGTSYAAGDTTNPLVVLSGVDFTPTFTEPAQIESRGMDKVRNRARLGVDSISSATITVESADSDVIAFCAGLTIDNTTNSAYTMYVDEQQAGSRPRIGVMVFNKEQDFETGAIKFGGRMMLDCEVSWQEGQTAYQALQNGTFTITPTEASKLPNGLDVATDLSFGMTESDLTSVKFTELSKQFSLATSFGNVGNAISTIQLPYLPTSSDATGGAENWFIVYDINAGTFTETAVTSVSTSTGLVTLASPLDSATGEIGYMIYQTNFVAS